MKNSNKPIAPTHYMDQESGTGELYCDEIGLTKREHFAALAMQGLLSGGYAIDDARNRANDVSSEAVSIADALLLELEK